MSKDPQFCTQLSFLPSLPASNLSSVPQKTKAAFEPPTLEGALSDAKVKENAMLWLRMSTKKDKDSPKLFLFHQMNEVRFKRTESDPVTCVRRSVLRQLIHV